MPAPSLDAYRAKRDPARTPEPYPEGAKGRAGAAATRAKQSATKRSATKRSAAKQAAPAKKKPAPAKKKPAPAKKKPAPAKKKPAPAKKKPAPAKKAAAPAKKAAAPAKKAAAPAKKRSVAQQAAPARKKPAPASPPAARRGPAAGGRFVVQEHHATSLHWDFRLERGGVLVSWAVPKGLPLDPGTNRLAVHTEDHPLEYATFEGTIPAGEYGGGTVTVWDHGRYECEKWSEREVMVVLHGDRVEGRYVLFRTRGTQWMVHRMDPSPAGWGPLPDLVRPMLAVTGSLPGGRGWAYEYKWDGMRAVAYVDGGRVRLLSRSDRDVTGGYPELRRLGEALGSRQAVLDGEIVALDDDGRPSFGALQARMQVADEGRARRLARQVPVTYMVFDVLHLDGQPTVDRPYRERRKLLEGLALAGPAWAVPPSYPGPGEDVLASAQSGGLEGVVAKRLDSPYRPGRRHADWTKAKWFLTQEVVVGGWSAGQGRRGGGIGALLLGVPDDRGLAYVGKVGTGFTDAMLDDLAGRLGPLARRGSPFRTLPPAADRAGVTWVEPTTVGEVRFGGWTRDRRLRQASWRGLRLDKRPDEVVREA